MSQSVRKQQHSFETSARAELSGLCGTTRVARLPSRLNGTRSLPYWSTSARAARAAKIWGSGLRVESMPLDAWRDSELPAAASEGLMIGVNWSGPRLVGWSFTPVEVLRRLAAAD
ncbi:DUF2750 domain-containing protein [Streptomyces mirabilis]|uniref:DUF2750 domain-containing protein n=1 Tax=Streptomyces mirabilis TaxID=68239 RepID=UPI00332127DF